MALLRRAGTHATTQVSCPGLAGASSTPRLRRIPQPSLEYWIARSSRAMTASAWRANAWQIVPSAYVIEAYGHEHCFFLATANGWSKGK
ncbi:hypothetical protein CVM73_14375 [Bradyrhizobium forestalis]|uniref:Uncharacterized protein n=1 Tax=Bradyrhizobium forestalis TaxID=1419263 RepID=A0A2M8R9C5_9BRAD|nr:hypothetical protein CVM73_14375 [Bradyrhizobium forestalis]